MSPEQIQSMVSAYFNALSAMNSEGWGKNGKQGIAEGISTFELDESGKIQQVSSYWDDAAMMRQIRD
jgi:hypothetical protein